MTRKQQAEKCLEIIQPTTDIFGFALHLGGEEGSILAAYTLKEIVSTWIWEKPGEKRLVSVPEMELHNHDKLSYPNHLSAL